MGSAAVRGLVKRRSERDRVLLAPSGGPTKARAPRLPRRGCHLLAVKHSAETGNLRLGQLGRTRPRDVQDRQPGPTLW
jgi:hypothetical protein